MGQSSFSWTSGPSYQYSYDIAGRPTGMNQWDPVNQVWNTVTGNGTFNAAGQMTGWQEYGYYNLSRSYDPARGWMTGLTASGSLNLSYAYNSGGQVTSVTDTINPGQGVTSYTYDNLDRLGSATTPNWGLSWTYDGFGNRLTQSGTGTAASVTQTLGYDGTSNHITSISTYFYGIGYDANGNASQIPGTNGQYSYLSLAYDVFDRVIHESGNYMGAGPSTAYDAFGRRIAKNLTDGTTRIYFYDPAGREVAEYNFNPNATCNYSGTYYTCTALGSPTATYTYFAGQRVGQWTDRVGSRRYTPVGSAASSYYPYGEEITGTANDTYKYASLYRDSDSGLDYAKHRYYAGSLGRFLTPDPFGERAVSPTKPGSWNAYHYSGNDPINFHDPSGLLEAAPGYCPAEYENCDWDPDPGDPGGDPGGGGDPPADPPPSCSGNLRTSGTPGYGLSLTVPPPQFGWPNPNGNQLGSYTIGGQQPGAAGSYFGVELDFSTSGGSGWKAAQSASGQISVVLDDGTTVNVANPSNPNDGPEGWAVRYPAGTVAWVDAPGITQAEVTKWLAAGYKSSDGKIHKATQVNWDATFKSTVTFNGTALCGVNWSEHMSFSSSGALTSSQVQSTSTWP